MQIVTTNDLIDFASTTDSIRQSSNFNFAYQFLLTDGCDLSSPNTVRDVFDFVVANPELHYFLKESFNPLFHDSFVISPLHEHCQIGEADDEFADVMARAATDRLGVYSKNRTSVLESDRAQITDLFSTLGIFNAFSTRPGTHSQCSVCQTTWNHYFTNWFYSIGIDYCFIVTWPKEGAVWIGCLSDTD